MDFAFKGNRENLEHWLDHIYQLYPLGMEYKLERILEAYEKLELPKFKCPVITVAGTNGKGSTVTALSAMYATEYKTGSFISPHLRAYNERIRINNENVSDELIIEAFSYIEEKRGDTYLTFFEFSTLAAIYIFIKQEVDVAIFEIGLGGRLDAVNILENDLAVITSIGLDHMKILGNDLESIAAEKAGIIKQGKPVVISSKANFNSIKKKAASENAKLYQEHIDFSLDDDNSFFFEGKNKGITINNFKIFRNSLSLVLSSYFILENKLPLKKESIINALSNVSVPGRQQKLYVDGVEIVLDLAHNEDGAKFLAKYLGSLTNTQAIWYSLSDKELTKIVSPLKDIVANWHIPLLGEEKFSVIKDKRASSKEQLETSMQENGIKDYSFYEDFDRAFDAAIKTAGKSGRVVILGGFAIVAKALDKIDKLKGN